ncbi:MAG: hypothetical protein EHM61_10970 [Acidobacteria bacterium]|nr:MAG: hypothetical protein EHM61_10970 [Acidobacteriota bacterium]
MLVDCRSKVISLKREARSINHAFTLLSQEFETHRISHTANVFERVFYWEESDQKWRCLDELRAQAEARFESEVLLSWV